MTNQGVDKAMSLQLEVAMVERAKLVGVVRGAPSAQVQETLGLLVDRWQSTLRIAGVIAEGHGLPDRACSAGYFRIIGSGERFPIFQDQGPGSVSCHIEGSGALTAAQAVQRDIAAGCDLVVLNKFGKLEAAGEGLRDAFNAAIEAHIPILTSVSPALDEPWTRFAGSLSAYLPADPQRIEEWWQAAKERASQ